MALDVTPYASFIRSSATTSPSTLLAIQQMLIDLARTKLASASAPEKTLAGRVLMDPVTWAQWMANDCVSTITQVTPTEAQFIAGVAAAWADYVTIDAAALATTLGI